MKKTYCPVCNKIQSCDNSLARIKNDKISFDLVFCNSCHMCLQYPAMNQEKIKEYYSSGYNLSNYQNDLEATFHIMNDVSEYRFNFIQQIIRKIPEYYLEIGPGVGTLMSIFEQSGSTAIGVEADTIAAQWMRDTKKLNIYNCFFNDFVKKNDYKTLSPKIDLVVMSHVLEHVPYPLDFLHQIKSLINPERGVLFIEVPNVLKPYSDGIHWQDYCDPGHIYYYSPEALQFVLRKAGYKVVSMATDEFSPYFPIFCLARPDNDSNAEIDDLQFKNEISKIQKAWLFFRVKHYSYFYPGRVLKHNIRRLIPN